MAGVSDDQRPPEQRRFLLKIPGAVPFGGIVIAATAAILVLSPQFTLSRAAIPLGLVAVVVIGIKLSTTELLGGTFNLQRTYFDICLTLAGAMVSLLIVQVFAGEKAVFPAAGLLLQEIGVAPGSATRAVGIWALAASLITLFAFGLGVVAASMEKQLKDTQVKALTTPKKNRYEFTLGLCQVFIVVLGSASFAIFFSTILLRS